MPVTPPEPFAPAFIAALQAAREAPEERAALEAMCTSPGWWTPDRDSARRFVEQAVRKGFTLTPAGDALREGGRAAVPITLWIRERPRDALWLLLYGAGAERWALEAVTRDTEHAQAFVAGQRPALAPPS